MMMILCIGETWEIARSTFRGRSMGSENHAPTLPAGMSAGDVRDALTKVLSSQGFVHSERLSRFLHFAVESALAGETDQLKEYLIGVEVFDRKQDFDPRLDPIVRVEAGRLRSKLRGYYEAEGQNDPPPDRSPQGGLRALFPPQESAGFVISSRAKPDSPGYKERRCAPVRRPKLGERPRVFLRRHDGGTDQRSHKGW